MSSTQPPAAPTRSTHVVNEEIRALWMRAGGRLSAEQRKEYERLVAEWATGGRITDSDEVVA